MAGRMDAGDIPASSPCRLAPCCPATRGISMAARWTFPTRSGLCQSRVRLRVFEDSSISHHQGLARPPSSRKSWREGEPRTTVCRRACHIVTYLEYIYIYTYLFIYFFLFILFIFYLFIYFLSIYLFIYLFIYLCIYLFIFFNLFIYLFIFLFIYLFIYYNHMHALLPTRYLEWLKILNRLLY
jgi:hypothetical protein